MRHLLHIAVTSANVDAVQLLAATACENIWVRGEVRVWIRGRARVRLGIIVILLFVASNYLHERQRDSS